MSPTQRDEMAGRFGQLFGGIPLDLYFMLQKEIEPHEADIVEKVMHQLRREHETFSFVRLRELLQYESGRKNDVARVIQQRMNVKADRAAADSSFERAFDAVDALSDEELAELIRACAASAPGACIFPYGPQLAPKQDRRRNSGSPVGNVGHLARTSGG